MIITRAPLRIPLGGGGTDFPSYYKKYGGYILAFAIDLYVYVVVHPTTDELIHLKYRLNEVVSSIDEIKNEIARECIRYVDSNIKGLEISTFSDIPESSGLGGSSAFTVALLKALYELKGRVITLEDLFTDACIVERHLAGQPGGIQDQWFATYGGCHELYLESSKIGQEGRAFNFSSIRSSPVDLKDFTDNLRLVYTHEHRYNLDLAKRQDKRVQEDSGSMLLSLHRIRDLGKDIRVALEENRYSDIGKIFGVHWENKVSRDSGITTFHINNLYRRCLKAGAVGGKLLGLGGGGYLLLYTEKELEGIKTMDVGLDTEGVKVLYKSERDLSYAYNKE